MLLPMFLVCSSSSKQVRTEIYLVNHLSLPELIGLQVQDQETRLGQNLADVAEYIQ